MQCLIESEIAPLKKVIIHSPGPEIEVMTPESAQQLLYNDIIPLQVVAREHRELSDFLDTVCEVHQIENLLQEILEDFSVRDEMVQVLVSQYDALHRRQDLSRLSVRELAEVCVCGLPKKSAGLGDYLSPKEFDILPLPNLFFTRDSAMGYRNGMVIASMASPVRNMESVIMSKIVQYHSLFNKAAVLNPVAPEDPLSGSPRRDSIEGGDFIVLRKDVICMGISERTTAGGADRLIQTISRNYGEPLTVFAVILPKKRAFIHLDMIFNRINEDQALIYHPLILGRNKVRVVRIDVSETGEMLFSEEEDLLQALANAGIELDCIRCGGNDLLSQEREQWMSGANMFAFAPGKIIGYRSNEKTLEELDKAGYAVRSALNFIRKEEYVSEYKRLAVTIEGVELARGGGGIRCMTMPVQRA